MKLMSLLAIAGLSATAAVAQESTFQKDPGTTNRAGASQPANAKVSKATQEFKMNAASGNALEVETSRIALQKSQNQDVKSFAQMMVADHTKVGEQMKSTMQTAGLAAPADQLTPKHKDMVDKLNQTSGGEFDSHYVAVQIKAHDEAVNLFSRYAKNGDNQELQQFAVTTLPALEKHKTMIEALKAKVVGGASQQSQ